MYCDASRIQDRLTKDRHDKEEQCMHKRINTQIKQKSEECIVDTSKNTKDVTQATLQAKIWSQMTLAERIQRRIATDCDNVTTCL